MVPDYAICGDRLIAVHRPTKYTSAPTLGGVETHLHARFTDPTILDQLEAADDAALDTLSFGIVAMGADGVVMSYNAAESRLAGLPSAKVIGRHFFSRVAPCTNNFMIAQRFETEPELDSVVDYVFTLRMAPTPVRLRLLKQPGRRRMYMLVERR